MSLCGEHVEEVENEFKIYSKLHSLPYFIRKQFALNGFIHRLNISFYYYSSIWRTITGANP